MKKILLFALIFSILSLAVALISQYGFGLKPCELCIAQRVPYALVVVISALVLYRNYFRTYLLYAIAALFIVGGGIASYHTAVEKHWVEGPSACTSSESLSNQSVEDLLKKIQNAPIVACDQPQWEFHGMTMAAINALWSLSLAVYVILATRRIRNA